MRRTQEMERNSKERGKRYEGKRGNDTRRAADVIKSGSGMEIKGNRK